MFYLLVFSSTISRLTHLTTPYYEIVRQLSTQTQNIPASAVTHVGGIRTPGTTTFSFNSITLNSRPDRLIIFARKPISQQTSYDSDFFYPISNININFNNCSGILSTASQYELWKMSREAGSNASWTEFRGYGMSRLAYTAGLAVGFGGLPAVLNGPSLLELCSAPLILEFGKHITLNEDYYAPGSIGNYVLQFSVTVQNHSAADINGCELVLAYMNSGSLITERGTSSIYTSILTKSDVLEASQQEPISHRDVKRIVGGNWWDDLKSGFTQFFTSPEVKSIAKVGLPIARKALQNSGNQYATMAGDALQSFGYGKSGGGYSGGVSALSKRLK